MATMTTIHSQSLGGYYRNSTCGESAAARARVWLYAVQYRVHGAWIIAYEPEPRRAKTSRPKNKREMVLVRECMVPFIRTYHLPAGKAAMHMVP